MIELGEIIVLKNYRNRTRHINEAGIINRFFDEPDDRNGKVEIKWIEKENVTLEDVNNIKKVTLHNISYCNDKIEVGDIVVTDGDGSRRRRWIVGKIGEIKSDRFFVWNNTLIGGMGDREVKEYKFSWVIKFKNEGGKLGIIRKVEKPEENEFKCYHCEKIFLNTEAKKGLDEQLYCKDCYDFIHFKCENCDEIITKKIGKKGTDDKWYCVDCWSEIFAKCFECDTILYRDDSRYSETTEEHYCETCYIDKFVNCHHCETELLRDDAETGADGEDYCSDCWSERYFNCHICGHAVHQDDGFYDEEQAESYCSDCWSQRKSKYIHEYGYRPEAELKKEKWEEDLYLGIELEVQHEDFKDKAEKFIKFLEQENIEDRIYLKSDSSIGDGFEIVTHPSTLYYNHKHLKMEKIIKWLKKEEFEAEESGDCGLHIHINKSWFTDLDIAKLRLFFRKNEEQLKIFSKRNEKFSYCKFETYTDKEIINNYNQSDKYWAINLKSTRETVEIRLFRATLDNKRFLAIMQFSEAISRFVKYVGITSFLYGENKYRGNSWLLFIDWAKQQNTYKDMINHLADLQLCDKEKLKCV